MTWLDPLADGRAHVVSLEPLPSPLTALWRGMPVWVQLQLTDATVPDLDALAAGLPHAVTSLLEDLWHAGLTPPFWLDAGGRVTVGNMVRIGRLEVGSPDCRVGWRWQRIDYPLAPRAHTSAAPAAFRVAIQRLVAVKPLEPAVPIAPAGPTPSMLTPLYPVPWTPRRAPKRVVHRAVVDDLGILDELPSPAGPPRVLQCTVGPDAPRTLPDNVLRTGANAVDVFLGALEPDTLVGHAVPDLDLAFGDDDWVTVQVQLTPLAPAVGPPSVGMLLVPRHGRSATLRLAWHIPPRTRRARAQLAVTREGRVVALAELSGTIGATAKLTGRLTLGQPDADRPPAGGSLVLTGDAAGTPTLIAPGEQRVELLPHLRVLAENVRDALNRITVLPDGRSARAREAARKVLVAAAQAGRDLYLELEPLLGTLTDEDAVQVVTALAPQALPLELLYLLPAPADDAPVCPTWLAGGECGAGCWSEDAEVVCPAGFWGVSRVVERHYLPARQGEAVLHIPTPDDARPALGQGGLALAASAKVTDQVLTKAGFDPKSRLTTWNEWRSAVAAGAGLLVLLPHTLPKPPSLEVSGQVLHRSRITARYVAAPTTSGPPTVILFGCDTGGSADDPVGYPTRLLGAGAGVVFGSFSLLRAPAAAALASRLVAALRAPERAGEPVGGVLTRVRRESLRTGVWAALALTGYGDANWRVFGVHD